MSSCGAQATAELLRLYGMEELAAVVLLRESGVPATPTTEDPVATCKSSAAGVPVLTMMDGAEERAGREAKRAGDTEGGTSLEGRDASEVKHSVPVAHKAAPPYGCASTMVAVVSAVMCPVATVAVDFQVR